MKKSVFLFLIFLLFTAGCTYYYVVHIKGVETSTTKPTVEQKVPEKSISDGTSASEYAAKNSKVAKEEKPSEKNTAKKATDRTPISDIAGVTLENNSRSMTIYYPSGAGENLNTKKVHAAISNIAKELVRTNGSANIIAHTDNNGNPKAQFELGKKYADSIKKLFLEEGIKEDNLRASSMGPTQPDGDNSTEKGRAQNRRIVIVYTN